MRLEDARTLLGRRALVLLHRSPDESYGLWVAGVLLDVNEWGEATVRTTECIRYLWPWLEVIEGYGTAQETICAE